jgi:hypothetical protein
MTNFGGGSPAQSVAPAGQRQRQRAVSGGGRSLGEATCTSGGPAQH